LLASATYPETVLSPPEVLADSASSPTAVLNDRQRAASTLMGRVPQPKFRPDAQKRD